MFALKQLNRKDLIALALILAVALAFVWPLFVRGWVIPQGGGDLVSFLWPTYRYAAQHLSLQSLISNPRALLWNPTLYSGYPFAADNQTGLFYPPNLSLFALFPDFPYQALEALVAFHLFIAGAGMYLFMRREMLERGEWRIEIGLAPALAFMASDVFITHLGNYNIVAVSAYLPLILLCLRSALITNNQLLITNIRWSLLGGFLFGLAILAGHAQMSLILALACGLNGLYELVAQRHWRVLVLGGLTAIIAFGIAAVALLPTFEMLQYTARSALNYEEASRWSLPPLGLAGMISPLVFGRGARNFWPPWDRVEFGYIGAAALTLALFARGKQTRFYWLLALAGLLIALGKYTPVHQLLFDFVPGFSSIRVPARFILLTNFALAVLMGYTLADRQRIIDAFRREGVLVGIVAVVGVVCVLLAPLLLGRSPAWEAAILVVVTIAVCLFLFRRYPVFLPLLIFAELFAFGGFVEVDRGDPALAYKRGPAVEYLFAQPGPFRIDVASSAWQPDAPAVFGLESIAGISNPLALARYDQYYWSVGYRGSPQYNFLNAQFVVADKNAPPADNTFVPVFNEDPDVDVYLNTNARPRVSLIYDTTLAADSDSAFSLIHTPDFSPASQVILESPNPNYQLPVTSNPITGSSNLYYTKYSAGQFAVVAQTPAPAFVVLAEVWYPGWTATVNGVQAQVLRANTAFMAVEVPAGENTIEFQFNSPMVAVGLAITIVTFLIIGLALFGIIRRK